MPAVIACVITTRITVSLDVLSSPFSNYALRQHMDRGAADDSNSRGTVESENAEGWLHA